MAALTSGLEGVLTRLALDPKKLILIVEVGPTEEGVRGAGCKPGVCLRGYVQWLIFSDGSFVAEISSSASLDPAHALTEDHDRQLLALGWNPPAPPGAPNFYRVALSPAEVPGAVTLALRTLTEVFSVEPDEVLLVKLAESHSRYATPLEEATAAEADEREHQDDYQGAVDEAEVIEAVIRRVEEVDAE
jgi:hypothetical protein